MLKTFRFSHISFKKVKKKISKAIRSLLKHNDNNYYVDNATAPNIIHKTVLIRTKIKHVCIIEL